MAPMSDASSTAQTSAGSRRVSRADGAELILREIVAAGTRVHALADRDQRVGEPPRLFGRLLEQMVGEPQRRLPADAGQLRELGGQIFDRRHLRTGA